jgi:CHASE1-domain containing sensor protein
MLIGVLWGLFAAAAAYRRTQRSERALVLREASPTLAALSPRTHHAA